MKILGIIFIILGIVGTLYFGLKAFSLFLLLQTPFFSNFADTVTNINLQFAIGSLLFVLLGFVLVRKREVSEDITSKMINLRPYKKKEGDEFSLKIINLTSGFLLTETSVGIKINDEDKGRTVRGEESTYSLPNGSHKLQFYTTLSKNSVKLYPVQVIEFTNDTTLIVSFKYNKTWGTWEITN